jgi:hypothetical protein
LVRTVRRRWPVTPGQGLIKGAFSLIVEAVDESLEVADLRCDDALKWHRCEQHSGDHSEAGDVGEPAGQQTRSPQQAAAASTSQAPHGRRAPRAERRRRDPDPGLRIVLSLCSRWLAVTAALVLVLHQSGSGVRGLAATLLATMCYAAKRQLPVRAPLSQVASPTRPRSQRARGRACRGHAPWGLPTSR